MATKLVVNGKTVEIGGGSSSAPIPAPILDLLSPNGNETFFPFLKVSDDESTEYAWDRIGKVSFYVCFDGMPNPVYEGATQSFDDEEIYLTPDNAIVKAFDSTNECYVLWFHRDSDDSPYSCSLGHYECGDVGVGNSPTQFLRIGDLVPLSGGGNSRSSIVGISTLAKYSEESVVKNMTYYNYLEPNWEIGDLILTFFQFRQHESPFDINKVKVGVGKIIDFDEGYSGWEAKIQLLTHPYELFTLTGFVTINTYNAGMATKATTSEVNEAINAAIGNAINASY